MDEDVAYLLGLLVARGTISEQRGERTLVLSFPFKSLIVTGPKQSYHQQTELQLAITQVRDRIGELLGGHTQVLVERSSCQIVTRLLQNTMGWRNLRLLTGGRNSFREFEIPEEVMSAPTSMQREFVRGLADAGGYIRRSNTAFGQRRRVYLEINNANWAVPVQLCYLLQHHLGVPVSIIQWGHPNVRTPYRPDAGLGWTKEHQVKIFAEAFAPIGFNIRYKQELLEQIVGEDKTQFQGLLSFCNPSVQRRGAKPPHPEEHSPRLPPSLQGRHFDNFKQICLALGCAQARPATPEELQLQLRIAEAEEPDLSAPSK